MTPEDRARVLEESLQRQLGWIAAAESRVPFVFTISTGMLGVLAGLAPEIGKWSKAPAVCAFFAGLFGLTSLLFLCFSSFPRTSGPEGSLIYFGGISKRKLHEFREAMTRLSIDAYTDDLKTQIHRNAQIASKKFLWIQRALICLYLAVLPWLLAIYLLYSLKG